MEFAEKAKRPQARANYGLVATIQIALLRGINLGARNRIAMPQLRQAFEQVGLGPVRTYLQSGNAVLVSDLDADHLAEQLQRVIAERFSLDVPAIVRTRDELAEVVARNPLAGVASDPKRYQVSFLERPLDAGAVAQLRELATADERLVALGREIFSWHPGGVARSRLWARLADRRLGVTATSRNWTTVTALLALADA